MVNTQEKLFWMQEAQKMANAFWFWALAAVLCLPFMPPLAILPGIAAVLCIIQSFKATERANR